MQYEQFGADESYDSEDEDDDDVEDEGVVEGDEGEIIDHDNEGLDVINKNVGSDGEDGEHGDDDFNIRDLYSGVQSLIQGDQSLLDDV